MLFRSLFNKAYDHISDRIDKVYKELTKGAAAPTGGVAYLTLEDSEVRRSHSLTFESPLTLIRCRNRTSTASSTTPCRR